MVAIPGQGRYPLLVFYIIKLLKKKKKKKDRARLEMQTGAGDALSACLEIDNI